MVYFLYPTHLFSHHFAEGVGLRMTVECTAGSIINNQVGPLGLQPGLVAFIKAYSARSLPLLLENGKKLFYI